MSNINVQIKSDTKLTEGGIYLPAELLDDAQGYVDKANRKLGKAGINERFSFVVEHFMVITTESFPTGTVTSAEKKINVVLSVPSISYGGWNFVAVVEPLVSGELVVNTAPGQDLNGYVPTDMHCDHCGYNRDRATTIIVRNEEGETKQVGKSCLKLFLGLSPVNALWALSFRDEFAAEMDNRGSSFSGGAHFFSPLSVIAMGLAASDMGLNFKPASFDLSTRDDVYEIMFARPKKMEDQIRLANLRELSVAPETLAQAAVILDFAKSIEGQSDYAVKMRTLLAEEFVATKFVGFVVSSISVYNKHLDRKREEETRTEIKNCSAGAAGDSIKGWKATVYKHFTRDGFNYGSLASTILFLTEDGYMLKWFASSRLDGFNEGDAVTFTGGTIKDVNLWNDKVQTIVTRVKV